MAAESVSSVFAATLDAPPRGALGTCGEANEIKGKGPIRPSLYCPIQIGLQHTGFSDRDQKACRNLGSEPPMPPCACSSLSDRVPASSMHIPALSALATVRTAPLSNELYPYQNAAIAVASRVHTHARTHTHTHANTHTHTHTYMQTHTYTHTHTCKHTHTHTHIRTQQGKDG